MDLNEIKKLIGEDGAKLIIVENDRPVMVITSFDDYQKMKAKPEKVQEDAEGAPRPLPPELDNEELKIEDLPF